jgi:hypothetical protein
VAGLFGVATAAEVLAPWYGFDVPSDLGWPGPGANVFDPGNAYGFLGWRTSGWNGTSPAFCGTYTMATAVVAGALSATRSCRDGGRRAGRLLGIASMLLFAAASTMAVVDCFVNVPRLPLRGDGLHVEWGCYATLLTSLAGLACSLLAGRSRETLASADEHPRRADPSTST